MDIPNSEDVKILKNLRGKIVFVGTLRQIKRRLKKFLESGPLPFLLWQARQIGYTIEGIDGNYNNNDSYKMGKIRQKLKEIPRKPGVYQFKDKDGEVIYIGKAKDLKARVGQYLAGHDEREQVPFLLAEAADIDYTVVNNELESLFLENTLIKQYLPKYNIQLRDDKNYAFIKIDYSFEIPQITIARKVDSPINYKLKTKNSFFGPYTAAYKIRHTLNLMRRILPFCSAQKVSSRPCFYYYLHRCPGVCVGKISVAEYRKYMEKIEDFLSGNVKKITTDLRREMKDAARHKKFELAARLRDQLEALRLLDERQTVILPKAVDWDMVSVFSDHGFACVNLFKIRSGKLQDKENFVYELTDPDLRMTSGSADNYRSSVLQRFLEQYYLETSSAPKEIYLQASVENPQAVQELVKSRFSKKPKILVPKKGKAKELIKLGALNAEEHLKHWLQSQAGHLDKINQGLERLKEALKLEKIPERIEGYDISNIQGTNAVGSMVVFSKGLPAKSEYRKFRIKSKATPDDFAMMKEMLTRRFARMQNDGKSEILNPKSETNSKSQIQNSKTWPTPDLIVIDGGKGQLSAALEVLQTANYQLPTIPVIGLAKRIEEIFVPGKSNPILLDKDDPALQMLQRLRDEAHRFGVTYHRALRSKQAVKSALDDIPGIGPKTKKLLKEKFGTVANIRKASLDDLAAVAGEHIAQLIQQSL